MAIADNNQDKNWMVSYIHDGGYNEYELTFDLTDNINFYVQDLDGDIIDVTFSLTADSTKFIVPDNTYPNGSLIVAERSTNVENIYEPQERRPIKALDIKDALEVIQAQIAELKGAFDIYGIQFQRGNGEAIEASEEADRADKLVIFDMEGKAVITSELTYTQFEERTATNEDLRDETKRYRDEAEGFRNESEGFRNSADAANSSAESFRDETELLRDQTQAIVDNFDINDFDHNDLSGVQGGGVNDKQHITTSEAAEVAELPNRVNQDVRDTATPTFKNVVIDDAVADNQAVTLKQLNAIDNSSRRKYVEAIESTPPIDPFLGSRYIVDVIGTGAWANNANDIAEWNGTSWTFETPEVGWVVYVYIDESDVLWDGGQWEYRAVVTADHNDLSGLQGGTANDRQHLTTTQVTQIATNTTNIATNTANIATNTTNIATNTASIAANVTAIAELPEFKITLTSSDDQIALGSICTLNATGDAILASATDIAGGELYLSLDNAAIGEDFELVKIGIISVTPGTYVINSPVYLSEIVGEFTTTAPTTSLSYVKIIGHVIADNKIQFDPGPTFIELL